MVKAGEDVTFIDMWPEHVGTIERRADDHAPPGRGAVHGTARALHLTEVQHLSKEAPVDIAFVCTKSYDTEWAALMIRQYLAPTAMSYRCRTA